MGYTLEQLKKKVDKKYGKNTLIRASQYPKLKRLSTGILAVDLAIGGGIPLGRTMILTGMESTSKTTVSLYVTKMFQNTCKNCYKSFDECECDEPEKHKVVFLDVEGTFDKEWASNIGVNLDELYLSQPQFSEQAVDIAEASIRAEDVDLLIVDSIAMMSPAVEIEKSAEKSIVGNHAKLVNRMCRAIQAGLNSRGMMHKKPSVIMINQVREKVGVNFGSPHVMPGGKGQLFSASIIMKLLTANSDIINEASGGKPVGMDIRLKVTKNKTYPPHKKGTFRLYVDNSEEFMVSKGEVDNCETMVRFGESLGILEKDGSWYKYVKDGEELLKAQGVANFGWELKQHPDIANTLENEIKDYVYAMDVEHDE